MHLYNWCLTYSLMPRSQSEAGTWANNKRLQGDIWPWDWALSESGGRPGAKKSVEHCFVLQWPVQLISRVFLHDQATVPQPWDRHLLKNALNEKGDHVVLVRLYALLASSSRGIEWGPQKQCQEITAENRGDSWHK